jgi:hypothetical protein
MAGAMTFDRLRPRAFFFPDGKHRAGALTLDQLNTSIDTGN